MALSSDTAAADGATESRVPGQISAAKHEQIATIMSLTNGFDLTEMNELRRQMNERQNQESILMRFPAEIRNTIFEMAFLDPPLAYEEDKTAVSFPVKKGDPFVERFREFTTLILGPTSINACRQMRRECRSLLCLDKISVTKCAKSHGNPIRSVIPSSPAQLRQDLQSFTHFKAYLHDSVDDAVRYSRRFSLRLGRDFTGTLCFHSSLGFKHRSFEAYRWDLRDLDQRGFKISEPRRAGRAI
ncbi:hypothetical protein PRZ48_003250 [Zasmidium cellare]|uniref:Uncharacterized protein n=1 Tax=Zasmidium cellare TaxID=395010 RepID=A0ABR0EUL8_ZASCE|nr:hypothetical protein PRZ48_003250 [Zasmidium cellare]